ncbi:MAG TPA: hypothetical protein VGQ59_13385 [Cyclobacteriaceae bacterium]|jgi:hypothetical protein|nr:hypothetical protein [Cyclobacteriaceae bacterium]
MGKFEQSWKEAFEGTELSPSDSVWVNINRDLAAAEGETMKKRIVFYQRIAAASVLFALLIGSLGIYRWNDNRGQIAQNKTLENALPSVGKEKDIVNKEDRKANSALSDKGNLSQGNERTESVNEITSPKSTSGLGLNVSKINSKTSAAIKNDKNLIKKSTSQDLNQSIVIGNEITENKNFSSYQDQNQNAMAFVDLGELELLPIPEIHEGPKMVEIIRILPAIPGAFMVHNEKKTVHEQVWASVTAAAGSYNPNINSYSNYSSFSASQMNSGSNSSSVVGSSYSYGMLAGVRVAKRIVLQSGIQYLNQSINSTSNISSPTSLDQVAFALVNNSPASSVTTPYAINSANEFVSVPVQAGYLFIDRKMGLQLNTGVSTEFFLRNTLSDPSGQRQSYSQGAGQDSPYRSVNFSGLLSSEVSYKLGDRYRVSIVPGFHYSFSPVLKPTYNSSGNPFVWDVGFRFRYIFR